MSADDDKPKATLVPGAPGDVAKLDIEEMIAPTPADVRAAQILEEMERGPRPLTPDENAFFLREVSADPEVKFMLDPKLSELTVDKLLGVERKGPKQIIRPAPGEPVLIQPPTRTEVERYGPGQQLPAVIVISGDKWSQPTNGADLLADLKNMREKLAPDDDWATPPSIFEAFAPTSPATFPPVRGIDFSQCDDRSVMVELQAGKVVSIPPLSGTGPIAPVPTTPVTQDEFTARRKQAIADLEKTDVPCVECGRAARLHPAEGCESFR